FYTMRLNDGKYQFNDDATATMTQMSRADFEGTFPKAPTEADLTISQATKTALEYWDKFTADKPDEYGDGKYIEGVMWEDDEYQSDYPWIAEVDAAADRIANWTQTGEYGITVAEMAGIDPFGEEVIESGRFEGKTGIEAWDEFMNTLTYKDVMDVVGQYQKRAFPAVSMNALSGQDSAWNYASTFNFTCNCTLAATWNVELSRKKGILIANMALLRGSNTWWGNSANTHRSPFGGRAFEYTSEDSFLGGSISSNETLGAVSRGLMTSMKHCALNDQETFRNGLNLLTWVSEQAARELYFKSFQMCAQEGQSTGLMGAFARAGRVSINVNYNFCTELVRNEWGSQTICITTDNYGGMRNCSPLDLLVRAGTDNIDSNTMSGTWDETLRDGLGAVVIGGEEKTESTIQWYTTRKMAMVFLFTHANTAMNKNGVDTSGWEGAEFEGVQAANVRGDVALAGDFDSVRYEISNGALPAGVTLNGETGAISGTPTSKAGTYSFTVRAVVENWITATQRFTINLDSAFEIDETNGKVGEDFYAVISSDSVNDEHYNQGVVYSVKSGSLPKGITLNEDGELEGVPEEAGVFTVLFNVQASNRGSGSRATTTVTNFEYEVTLTIEGDEVAEARVIRALERNARLFNAKALMLR
ncbi:MAG: putative Ig domain-containing protein, partial [Lachnospiraceae bacterium]|nr:putative Ig domain-containing protein [Lachnospiraceae bacterium]